MLSEPISHVDILPTLAALSGAELPQVTLDGQDLLPLFKGKEWKRDMPLPLHHFYLKIIHLNQ